MSLLIKGMNMPEYRDIYGDGRAAVYLCMLSVSRDGSAFLYCNDSDNEYCTVSEVPTPHGRLIDADELEIIAEEEFDYSDDIIRADDVWSAPTIIEAEG